MAIVAMGMFVASASFAATCGVMSVVSVASTDSGSGSQVWLKNESGASCGTIVNGGQKLFNLPSTTSDKTLAVILTAVSLNKKLWVAFQDTATVDPQLPGMIQIVSMQSH